MKKIKKLLFPLLAFTIPILIFFIMLVIFKFFSKNSFYIADALNQYVPTFKYYQNVLHGNASFPYTLSKGLGGTMYGAFFYGISSPINLLLYFFKDVELFLIITTLLRIGLSGLSMYIFLRYKNNNKIKSLIFSLCYSLSGYVIVYYSNIMWLDSVWIAPLLLISINKIIKENKYLLYVLLLFLALVSNYYTGYMLTLFSVIYFLYELYINYNDKQFIKNNLKKILYFFLITFLTGCLIAFILIPIAYEATNFSRGFNYKVLDINVNILDIFSGTYIGFGRIHSCTNYYGLLSYGSIAIIPLLISYFTNKEISKKEKKASIILLLILVLPVIIIPLNYIWHLFTVPNGFNYRYSFLLILFTIYLASKGFNSNQIKIKPYIAYYIFYLIISYSIGSANKIEPEYYLNYLNTKKIIITLVILLIYILLVIKNKKKILLALIPIEIILNTYLIFNESLFMEKRLQTNLDYIINDNIKIKSQKNDLMYRYETIESLNLNSPIYYNYYGIDSFLSSNNKNEFGSYYKINGIKRTTNFIKYTNSNILTDSLFALKYSLNLKENKDLETIKQYEFENNKLYFQKNKYAFPIVYTANKKIKELNYDNYQDLFFIQKIYNDILGDETNLFIELDLEKTNKTKYIINNPNKYSTIYLQSKNGPTNHDYEKFRPSDKYGVCIDCNDDKIELEFDTDEEDIKALALNTEELEKIRNKINGIKSFSVKNNKIYGEIESNEDGILILTIPYEEGFKIKIDDEKVKYYKILNGMIGIDLTKGSHKIELTYTTPGLDKGLIISCISLCILITLFLKKFK